jgi:hypothetical protein
VADTPSPKTGYVVSGCGCLLTLIGLGVAGFGAFHVFFDPRGKISADEAAPALGGGACCGLSSLLIVALGVYLVLRAKKAAEPPAPGDPTAPPS